MTIILAMKKSSVLLIWILILALMLRLLLIISVQGHLERAFEPDTPTYIGPALKLLHSEGFIEDPHRTPVYPLFIAFFYWLFGEQPLPIILAQIILSVLTVFITYLIGKKLLSETAGLIAAFLLAVSIESITHAFFLLTETLFTLLFLGSILAYIIFCQSRKRIWILISGVLMGLTILCRPIATYFPYLFLILVLFDQAKNIYERLIKVVIYSLSLLAVIVPWMLWNYSSIGIATISTISDYNLLFYNAASLQATQLGMNEEQVRDNLRDQVEQTLQERNLADTPNNRSIIYREIARKIISSDPLRYVYLHLKNDINNLLPGVTDLTEILGVTVGGKGTLAILNKDGLVAAIQHYFEDQIWLIGIFAPAIILLFLIYLTDLAGIGILAKEKKWFTLLIISLPLMYLMLIPGASSNQRFRVPAMPYISLLAAQGSIFLWNSAKLVLSKRKVLASSQQKKTMTCESLDSGLYTISPTIPSPESSSNLTVLI
jgi:4-amino-4-deoxy-L-arabinose transferase-like glycosyltransferase